MNTDQERWNKRQIYGADFETDHDGTRAWVVQWAISDGNHETTGRDLESMKEALKTIMLKTHSYVYFHNLKYDMAFLKYAIYDLVNELELEVWPIVRKGNPISVKLTPPKGSKYHTLTVRDSYKKLTMSLAKVARMFNMTKLDGFDFSPGWSLSVDFDNPANWEYVRMDARIVAYAMKKVHEDGNGNATTSGDAWENAKQSITGNADTRRNDKKWTAYFPALDLETDKKLRKGYMGGINISRHQGRNEGVLLHADVNSMYPSVMYYDELPHGEPHHGTGKPPEGSLFVVHGRFTLKLREGLIPWFVFKNGGDYLLEDLEAGKPIVETKVFHDMTLTSIDLNLLAQWYSIKVESWDDCEYWTFSGNTGMFRSYIDKYIAMKKGAKKGTLSYAWAKLMMNGLYGRFGLNPVGEEVHLGFDEQSDLAWLSEEVENEGIDAYLPFAMFVTAHARRRLLDYVLKAGPENVIHCDTDSCIHYGSEAPGVEYGKDLGTWDIESRPKVVYEGGFKRYVEFYTDQPTSMKDIHVACAGVPQKSTDDGLPYGMWLEILDNPEKICSDDTLGQSEYELRSPWLRSMYFNAGLMPRANTMKLIPSRVPGGIILKERRHKLSDCLRMLR